MDKTKEFQQIIERIDPNSRKITKTDVSDAFFKESYKIMTRLNQLNQFVLYIRPFYLGLSTDVSELPKDIPIEFKITHDLTEADKDTIDIQIQGLIKKCLSSIQSLEKLAEKLSDSHKQKSFFSTVDQEHLEIMSEIRQNVVYFLENKLFKITSLHGLMQEKRIQQYSIRSEMFAKMNRSPSLENMSKSLTSLASLSPIEDDEQENIEPELLAELETENAALLQEYSSALDQVHTATQSIHEISVLQSQMMHYLNVQHERIDQLHTEAEENTAYMSSANTQLSSAERNFKKGRMNVVVFILLASFVLLFLDWYG
jgi:syntaxin 18